MQNRYSEVPCIKRGIYDFIASPRIFVAGLGIEWISPKQHLAALYMRPCFPFSYLSAFIV